MTRNIFGAHSKHTPPKATGKPPRYRVPGTARKRAPPPHPPTQKSTGTVTTKHLQIISCLDKLVHNGKPLEMVRPGSLQVSLQGTCSKLGLRLLELPALLLSSGVLNAVEGESDCPTITACRAPGLRRVVRRVPKTDVSVPIVQFASIL